MNKINEIPYINSTKKIRANNSFSPKNKNNKPVKINNLTKMTFNNNLLLNNNNNIINLKNNKNKENSKKSEIKSSILSSFNKKNNLSKLKFKKRKSKHILNDKINEEQKEIDRNAILQRIKNREINHVIKRKTNDSSSRTNKINNSNQTEIQKTLNEIKNLNKNQQNKFSFYHFYNSNHLYFFIPTSKYEEIKPVTKQNNNYQILENLTLPQAFRPRMNYFGNIPKCIIQACSKGNLTMVKNFETCNLIWKLLTFEKMRLLTKNLFPFQKFNHFPCTYQLGRKDNLFKHFKSFKRLVPDLYNYIPSTYILPMDSNNFEAELKKNKKCVWIAKPVNMSRGRGIRLICNENDYKKLYKKNKNNKDNKIIDNNAQLFLISRYLDKPHLLNNKKYDLRIYVLVGSFTPLKIYLYYNGLVRFATENYEKGNYDNVFIHLTNYAINKKNPNYKKNLKNNKEIDDLDELEEDEEQEDDSSKWSLVEYKKYFKKDINSFNKIWKQIEDIVIKTILTVFEYNCREMSGNKNNNLFEIYGFDILIDESLRAWLLEVNVNPSLHCTSPLDLSIKTDLIIDIFNLVGIAPFNHNNNEELYDISKKKNDKNENKKMEIKLPKIIYNNSNKNTNLINNKLKIEKNFNPNNLKMKLPEYDDDYYKNMILMFQEERLRAKTTGFSLIFPKKDNIEYYSNILDKNNFVNDANIVLWEYILNNE